MTPDAPNGSDLKGPMEGRGEAQVRKHRVKIYVPNWRTPRSLTPPHAVENLPPYILFLLKLSSRELGLGNAGIVKNKLIWRLESER